MWNNYWGNRERRNVPQRNYNEISSSEDDEETFDSPLVSPTRPLQSREGSPVELAVPTLNDNVDEDLEQVSQTLRNVGHTHTFRGTRPTGARPEPEGNEAGLQEEQPSSTPAPEVGLGEAEVVEGHVVGVGVNLKVDADNEDGGGGNNIAAAMPDVVDFDVENGDDGDKAQDYARAIKVEFEPNDIRFWFSQLETEMGMSSIKSQWLKKSVLQRNLPNRQKEDVKAFLILSKTEAGATIYKDIKAELIRIYAPKPSDS